MYSKIIHSRKRISPFMQKGSLLECIIEDKLYKCLGEIKILRIKKGAKITILDFMDETITLAHQKNIYVIRKSDFIPGEFKVFGSSISEKAKVQREKILKTHQ